MKFLKKLNQDEQELNNKEKITYYLSIFFIGGIVGYIYEEIFFLIYEHILVNRGFLYGPFLPVYAWGALLMALFLKKFKKNPIIVFLLAVVVTGILEYFTGFFMLKIWHRRWWDYTGLFLNLGGHICLRSVVSFGIGGLLLMYIVDPLVAKSIKKYSPKVLNIIIILFGILYIVDTVLSFVFRNPF